MKTVQPIFADNQLWILDQSHFKDAVTFLVLNDKRENEYDDLELKKLISSQFQKDSEMREWTVDLFDKVGELELLVDL